MFLEMQIFALRDRLRISPKTSQGILSKILDFALFFTLILYTEMIFDTKKLIICSENTISLKKITNYSL